MYLGTLNLEGCNNTASMFYNCTSLNTINNIRFKQNENVVSANMFAGCTNLNIEHINFTDVKFNSTGYMFYNCLCFNDVVANKLFSEVNSFIVSSYAFARTGINNLFDFEQSGYQYNCSGLFLGCNNLTNINYNMYKNMRNIQSMFAECQNLQTVNFGLGSNVYNLSSMFSKCSNLTSVNLTTHINDMEPNISAQAMFSGCTNLTSVNITSQTNNIRYESTASMFSGCTNLTNIDFVSDLFKYTESTIAMFSGCTNLTSIGTNSINLNHCESISSMFYNCFNLTGSINLNVLSPELSISTQNVFANSGFNHITLNINSINTSSYYINLQNIISGCDNLKTFDLSVNAVITNDRTTNSFYISSSALPNLTDINMNVNINSKSDNYGFSTQYSTSNTLKNVNTVTDTGRISQSFLYMYNLQNVNITDISYCNYLYIYLYQSNYANINLNMNGIYNLHYAFSRLDTNNIMTINAGNIDNNFTLIMNYCNNVDTLNIQGDNVNCVNINMTDMPNLSNVNIQVSNIIQNMTLMHIDNSSDLNIKFKPNTNIQKSLRLYDSSNIVNLNIDFTNISYLNNLYISFLTNISNQSVDNIFGGLCNVNYGSTKRISSVFRTIGINQTEMEQLPNYNNLISSGWTY